MLQTANDSDYLHKYKKRNIPYVITLDNMVEIDQTKRARSCNEQPSHSVCTVQDAYDDAIKVC